MFQEQVNGSGIASDITNLTCDEYTEDQIQEDDQTT